MKFTMPVVPGIILKRYKRFLADVKIAEGEAVTAHVANTGSMATCWEEGWPVVLTRHDNPRRKLKYSLEMTSNGKSWIGVNTSITSKLAVEAIQNGSISELQGYQVIRPEASVGNSRIDLLLESEAPRERCYVEIKNVTLRDKEGEASFPDAVTLRGQKHLRELTRLKKKGLRAVMLYVIQREDVSVFAPAWERDPEYCRLLAEAIKAGVEVLPYQCSLKPTEIMIKKPLTGRLTR